MALYDSPSRTQGSHTFGYSIPVYLCSHLGYCIPLFTSCLIGWIASVHTLEFFNCHSFWPLAWQGVCWDATPLEAVLIGHRLALTEAATPAHARRGASAASRPRQTIGRCFPLVVPAAILWMQPGQRSQIVCSLLQVNSAGSLSRFSTGSHSV